MNDHIIGFFQWLSQNMKIRWPGFRQVAYHEAAHALMAFEIGLRVEIVIYPLPLYGGTTRMVEGGAYYVKKYDDILKCVAVSYAGIAIDRARYPWTVFLGNENDFHGFYAADFAMARTHGRQFLSALPEAFGLPQGDYTVPVADATLEQIVEQKLEELLATARAYASEFVGRECRRIGALAEELRQRGYLSYEDILEVLRTDMKAHGNP